jgi:hypothetical protein
MTWRKAIRKCHRIRNDPGEMYQYMSWFMIRAYMREVYPRWPHA